MPKFESLEEAQKFADEQEAAQKQWEEEKAKILEAKDKVLDEYKKYKESNPAPRTDDTPKNDNQKPAPTQVVPEKEDGLTARELRLLKKDAAAIARELNFRDPSDASLYVDPAKYVGDDGDIKENEYQEALKKVLEARSYLKAEPEKVRRNNGPSNGQRHNQEQQEEAKSTSAADWYRQRRQRNTDGSKVAAK